MPKQLRAGHSRREFVRLAGAGSLALFTSRSIWAEALAGAAAAGPVPYYGVFSELPVGAVKPRGWIKGWLERQLEGLTGHPENMAYPYDTCMYAGKIPPPAVRHGEVWWPYEQSGYFVDGAVRLSHLLDAPSAQAVPSANLAYLRENSGPGKLGESIWGWPDAVVGRALMAEHSATGDAWVARVLAEYFQGNLPVRGRDGYVFEEALYLHGLNGDPRLRALAQSGYDRYFIADPKSFSHEGKIRGDAPLRGHGVTAAEQLKLLPLMYCHTGDARALELANLAYRKVERDSLMADGGMVSAEALGTAAFNSLHETCDLTDWPWSMGYLLMAGGDAHWADLIERTTFNALPGALTKDFRQVQYFSSANQILASNTASPRIAPTRLSYRAAHDTECCAGNVNRAMPNYVVRMWMRMGEGLAATLYGPSEVTVAVGGQRVSITEETDYPFRETITFRIRTSGPAVFPLALRIPEWCAGATVAVNGQEAELACRPGTFATLAREHRDGDTIVLRLPMTVKVDDWFGGRAACVSRGPLVYSLPIAERRVEHTRDPAAVSRVLKGNDIQGFPAIEFFPEGEWRYGLEPRQKEAPDGFRVVESPMPENPFLLESAPVRIEAALRPIPQWASAWKPVWEPPSPDLKLGPHNPASLPTAEDLQAAGPARKMTLGPYGCTHLRLTTLPLI
jgi:hypothetical protein